MGERRDLVEVSGLRTPDMKPFLQITAACHLLLALVFAAGAAAQEYDGRIIREIAISGQRSLAEDTVKFYLDLEEGQAFDSANLNDRIHRLWSRSLIDDVRVEIEPREENGVAVIISLRERPTLQSVEYEGLKRISRTDITERITKDRIRVREGDPLDLGELHRLKASIEDLYREKGFRLAEAQFAIEEVSAGDRRVTVTIDEGDKVRIGEIDFEGNTVFRDARLRWAMKKTKQSNIVTRVLKKDVYNPAGIEEDLDSVRELYRKAGYKNVVLGDPEIEIEAKGAKQVDDEGAKRVLAVTVPVEEGDRWKLGEISVEGNERFSDELLLRQFRKPSGGWLRANVIDEGVETISELYNNTGHLFARVEPELVEREEQIADLVVRIDEGEQYRIGRIEFEGNTKTRDKVIRREMGIIQEGLVLNAGALKNSLLRIRQMEFFKIDEEDPVGFDFDNEEKTVDLTINGEEGERTELLFGGGFSEVDGFFGQFQFKTRNFLGRGETLGVSVQTGVRQDIFDLSYYIPWFLDRPQSVGFQIFKRRLDYNLLTGQRYFQDNVGGSVTYGRNLGLFGSASLSFTHYDAEEERTSFTIEGEPFEQDFSRTVSMLRFSLIRDIRDSRLQPTRGSRYAFSIDLAGGPLGGTTDFWRPRLTATKYIPVSREGLQTLLGFNGEVGFIEPLEGTELFFNDRFYLGGENSVRGFRYRSIWVRDKDGNTVTDEFGFPLGGDRSLQLNVEYHVVLGGPFRLIGYLDGGKVFADSEEFDLANFRMSTGLELQINVPLLGAPLRFIYARNLEILPDDRFESFQFSIGPSF